MNLKYIVNEHIKDTTIFNIQNEKVGVNGEKMSLLFPWSLTLREVSKGFHRTFATDAACQQRTLTPPDTWSCPILGLASVLMLRPISPELVLLLDF